MPPPGTPATLAIAGFGQIGRLYAKLIAEEGSRLGLRLTAVADPNPELKMPGIEQFRSAEELLGSPVDAILIASPPDTHDKIARLGLQAGKHVLIEKPPAESAAEGEKLIGLARERGVSVFFAYHARYNRSVHAAKKALVGAAVESIEVAYQEDVLRYHEPQSWVFREGVLKDSGVNALSVLVNVVPAECGLDVLEAEFTRSRRFGSITQARLTLGFGGRAGGTMTLDWTHTGTERRHLTIRTARDEFVIDIVSDRLIRNGEVVCQGDCEHDRLACEYREMLGDFAAHLSATGPSSDTRELRLLDTANRIGVVAEGP